MLNLKDTPYKQINETRSMLYTLHTDVSILILKFSPITYWSDVHECIIGMVYSIDAKSEFGCCYLYRDSNGKFNKIYCQNDLKSKTLAEQCLTNKITQLTSDYTYPKKLFSITNPTIKSKKLHKYFISLINDDHHYPAKKVFDEIGLYFNSSDNEFLIEFQSNQFDQRLWELYLWACLHELSFKTIMYKSPDFYCRCPLSDLNFTVEATTVSPSASGQLLKEPKIDTLEDMDNFLQNYMPMKFGSSLMSKFNKTHCENLRYWELEHSKNKPFVIAIADFHKESSLQSGECASLIYSQPALFRYLYGIKVETILVDGNIDFKICPANSHTYNEKTIDSNFFNLPESENISAILFSNSATIAKFSRIGMCSGFADNKINLRRTGQRIDLNSTDNKIDIFSIEVSAGDSEKWCDELQLFHNPNAKHPLPMERFPGILHHNIIDGTVRSFSTTRRHILWSYNTIIKYVKEFSKQ